MESMNLKEFVQHALVQVAQGIEGANTDLKDSDALVNPQHVEVKGDNSRAYGFVDEDHIPTRTVELIQFDVAVSAEKAKGSEGGIGIMVGSVGLGAKGKSDISNSSQSRIQFSIPMVFPSSNKLLMDKK
jgi:hypothetical protein